MFALGARYINLFVSLVLSGRYGMRGKETALIFRVEFHNLNFRIEHGHNVLVALHF